MSSQSAEELKNEVRAVRQELEALLGRLDAHVRPAEVRLYNDASSVDSKFGDAPPWQGEWADRFNDVFNNKPR